MKIWIKIIYVFEDFSLRPRSSSTVLPAFFRMIPHFLPKTGVSPSFPAIPDRKNDKMDSILRSRPILGRKHLCSVKPAPDPWNLSCLFISHALLRPHFKVWTRITVMVLFSWFLPNIPWLEIKKILGGRWIFRSNLGLEDLVEPSDFSWSLDFSGSCLLKNCDRKTKIRSVVVLVARFF